MLRSDTVLHSIDDLCRTFTPQVWKGYDVRSGADTDPAAGGESAYISDLEDVRRREGDARAPEFISLGAITVWGDYVGDDVNRSNCRSLLRDYPETFVAVRDAMSAEWLVLPIASLDALDDDAAEDLARLLIGLAEDYPVYDENDHGALEIELADEAWDAWVRYDLRRELGDHLSGDVVDAIDDEDLCQRFYAAVSDTPQPYYCESADSVVFPYWDDVVAALVEHYGRTDNQTRA